MGHARSRNEPSTGKRKRAEPDTTLAGGVGHQIESVFKTIGLQPKPNKPKSHNAKNIPGCPTIAYSVDEYVGR